MLKNGEHFDCGNAIQLLLETKNYIISWNNKRLQASELAEANHQQNNQCRIIVRLLIGF